MTEPLDLSIPTDKEFYTGVFQAVECLLANVRHGHMPDNEFLQATLNDVVLCLQVNTKHG